MEKLPFPNYDKDYSQEKKILDSFGDNVTKYLHGIIPVSWQRKFRDNGLFRDICNSLVSFGSFLYVLQDPKVIFEFLALGSSSKHLQLFNHPQTTLQYYPIVHSNQPKRVLFFVHGGAWGSGAPWIYRLAAAGAGIALGCDGMILLGYPVYPCSSIVEQKESVVEAINFLCCEEGTKWVNSHHESTSNPTSPFSLIVMGHSSGANISSLALLHFSQLPHSSDSSTSNSFSPDPFSRLFWFVGLSGVFDIERHFDWERERGVHLISPMGGAASEKRSKSIEMNDPNHHEEDTHLFWQSSPTLLLRQHLSQTEMITPSSSFQSNSQFWFPPTCLLHGSEDHTVPASSSLHFCQALTQTISRAKEETRTLQEPLTSFPPMDHADPILHLTQLFRTSMTSPTSLPPFPHSYPPPPSQSSSSFVSQLFSVPNHTCTALRSLVRFESSTSSSYPDKEQHNSSSSIQNDRDYWSHLRPTVLSLRSKSLLSLSMALGSLWCVYHPST